MICHPELISWSLRLYQGILKQVQNDGKKNCIKCDMTVELCWNEE